MNRNLKKWAASCARPAIQYVLTVILSAELFLVRQASTHIAETIIVGISLNGTTSKTMRDRSHAVGL